MSIKTAAITALAILFSQRLAAQDERDYTKLNTNLGMGVSVPLNPTARLAGASANIVAGAGYNFDKHNSIVGQFMWSGLPPNLETLRPISLAAQLRGLNGSGNLFTLTANYRLKVEGRTFGAYVIGGGGLYYRRARLSREVVVGRGTVCEPSWVWFGFSCVSGIVTEDQTLLRAGSTAFGGNAGVGFTIRINKEGYKFYFESRYHYAPTKNISTQLIPITLGFSW